MRCNSCGKFVSQEAGDPEVVDTSVDGDAVTVQVRITQCCAECSQELKEASFDIEKEYTLCAKEDHDHEVEVEDVENTSRSEGKGRYAKTFYGFSATVVVSCEKCELKDTVTISDEVMASGMEECQ